jgi:hypothetical protein
MWERPDPSAAQQSARIVSDFDPGGLSDASIGPVAVGTTTLLIG